MVYPEQTARIKRDILAGKSATYQVYSKTGGNRLLALQESGRLAQVQGDYRESAALYGEAIAFSDQLEDKALFSIGDASDSTMSVLAGNDLTMDYPVLPFERMMLHVLNSCDCLALGNYDGFGVDMRHLERIYGLAKEAERRRAEADETGYEQLSEEQVIINSNGLMATPSCFTPVAKNSYDNAYALYLMALYRETRGDMNEALSYYKAIRDCGIMNVAVEKGIVACTNRTAVTDEGEVIVFLEEGFMPGKREDHARVGADSVLRMTLPRYGLADCLPYQDGGPLVLFEGTNCLAKTTLMCDLAALAVKAHDERMKGIVGRKALTSNIATGLIAFNAGINGTFFFNPLYEACILFAGLFTCSAAEIAYLCNERPDLRSWTLLPRCVQVARFSLKSGRHELQLYASGAQRTVVVDVRPGGKTIVHGVAFPGMLNCFSATLGK